MSASRFETERGTGNVDVQTWEAADDWGEIVSSSPRNTPHKP